MTAQSGAFDVNARQQQIQQKAQNGIGILRHSEIQKLHGSGFSLVCQIKLSATQNSLRVL